MHCSLVGHPVLAQKEAVVAGENKNGIIQPAKLFECLVNPADAVIYRFNRSCIGPDKLGEFQHTFGAGIREVFTKTEYRAVDAVPGVQPFLDPFGFAFKIKCRPGIVNFHIIIDVLVFLLRCKWRVWCLMAYY